MIDLAATPHLTVRAVRATVLMLVGVLLVVSTGTFTALFWWLPLMVAATPCVLARRRPWLGRAGCVAETVIVLVIAAFLDGAAPLVLPYLVVPVLAASLLIGLRESVEMLVLALVVAVGAGALAGVLDERAYLVPVAQWLVLATLVAVVSVWTRQRWETRSVAGESEYAQATRLLAQLRTIARQLPGTLDPGSIGDRLLDELSLFAPADRGAVFTGSGGGRLEVLAQRGPDRIAWETSLDADTPIAEAWVSQQPSVASRSLDRGSSAGDVSALVIPLVTGVRTVGLVVLEADAAQAYRHAVVSQAAEVAGHAALRLETALLFDEVRSLATAEERQRLAREIHDGVAQELVMVGYGIDNAIADLPPDADAATEGLRALRAEVTRVITELRLSLFELRSDVDRHGGLGSAIAEYARTVASSAGMRVHLSLDETTARLPAAVETELLRIAQEAVTNARKHASATNLWVSCEVDPPYALLEVSDDGKGITGVPDNGRYGMSIMRERAERVRALLDITTREPAGTTVRVVLGTRAGHGSLTQRTEVAPDRVQ